MELSNYEQNFIDQSANYHSQHYHQSKSQLRKLEQEEVYLDEELKKGKISTENHRQEIKKIEIEKKKEQAKMNKYEEGYNKWKPSNKTGLAPNAEEQMYKIQIASVVNLKDICSYSDNFNYPNIEFKKSGNVYTVLIYPYTKQEAETIVSGFKSSGKYRDAFKIMIR